MYWIQCLECGNQTSADLFDCSCEKCAACNWSEPYGDDEDPPVDPERFVISEGGDGLRELDEESENDGVDTDDEEW